MPVSQFSSVPTVRAGPRQSAQQAMRRMLPGFSGAPAGTTIRAAPAGITLVPLPRSSLARRHVTGLALSFDHLGGSAI